MPRSCTYFRSHAFSSILIGDPASVIEDINNSANTKRIATVSMDIQSSNQKIVVTSQITIGSWSRTKVDFVVFDWDRAYPIIDLVDNPQGWEEGNDFLIFLKIWSESSVIYVHVI